MQKLLKSASLNIKDDIKTIKQEYYTYFCLCNNFDNQGIHCMTYNINKNFREKIDYDILEIIDK